MSPVPFFRARRIAASLVLGASLLLTPLAEQHLTATTLEQLSMGDLIQQSTAIVRARVGGSSGVFHGANIYTHYRIQVLETLKGSGGNSLTSLDVAVPGGVAGGMRQEVAGAPVLVSGQEYVLFLWTSRAGTTQVIGLSQGLFHLSQDSSGELVLDRSASSELMLDPSGAVVADQAVHLSLPALRNRIDRASEARR